MIPGLALLGSTLAGFFAGKLSAASSSPSLKQDELISNTRATNETLIKIYSQSNNLDILLNDNVENRKKILNTLKLEIMKKLFKIENFQEFNFSIEQSLIYTMDWDTFVAFCAKIINDIIEKGD